MPAGFRQVILLCAALGLCPVAALLIGGDPAGPLARGAALADAERDAGLYVEPAAHAWVASRPALLTVAAIAYVVAHVAVPGWALIWTWWLRRDAFPLVRDVFLVTQALTVALYVLVPTAPPRLVDPPPSRTRSPACGAAPRPAPRSWSRARTRRCRRGTSRSPWSRGRRSPRSATGAGSGPSGSSTRR